jgi:hypothetical protein
MALVNNCFRIYFDGCVEGSAHALLPGCWNSYRQFEKFINPDKSSTVLKTAANPPGYYLSRVYQPPITVGEMSWRLGGEGSLTANLYPAKQMSVSFTGSGDLNATAALVVSMLLAMTGSGTLEAAIQGRLNMSADLTGSGDLDAAIAALGSMVLELSGTGDLEAAIGAIGNMSIDLVVTGTGLTTSNVGAAVWSSLATINDEPGTMGEKLNAAGSAGDPWTTALPGSYAAGTAGDIIGNITAAPTVAEIWQHAVENGITAEEMIRAIVALGASKASGGGTNTIEFKSLDGTKTRLTLNVTDADGNRNNPTIGDLT